jgi:MFS transporter, PAT family, beta-lactamase induction signal transducer AmpG
LKNRSSLLFFLLYFFEGAPIGLVWWAIPTLMASQGITVQVLTTLTAMATLPWTFKFLIAPLVDRYFFSTRAYAFGVATFQFLMLLSLLGLTQVSLTDPLFFWMTLLISLFSAIQDVFIDAWAIGSVPENQRGSVNGAMQAGLLSGRWLFGAGLLIALATFSLKSALFILSGLLALSILYLMNRYRRDLTTINPSQSHFSLNSFKFIFSKKFLLLSFVAISTGFAFESFGAVIGPFFIANGFEKTQVGFVLSSTLISMLFGALIGGKIADIKGNRKVFLVSGIFLFFLVSGIGFLHLTNHPAVLILFSSLIYFFIGTFTSSSYAFYMTQSQGPMEATRFTFLMAMTNLCESLAAFSTGKIVGFSSATFSAGFAFTSVISLIGLLIFWKFFRSQNNFQIT